MSFNVNSELKLDHSVSSFCFECIWKCFESFGPFIVVFFISFFGLFKITHWRPNIMQYYRFRNAFFLAQYVLRWIFTCIRMMILCSNNSTGIWKTLLASFLHYFSCFHSRKMQINIQISWKMGICSASDSPEPRFWSITTRNVFNFNLSKASL